MSTFKHALRLYLPQRIRGRQSFSADGWQIVGGRRWSLVIFTNMTSQS